MFLRWLFFLEEGNFRMITVHDSSVQCEGRRPAAARAPLSVPLSLGLLLSALLLARRAAA